MEDPGVGARPWGDLWFLFPGSGTSVKKDMVKRSKGARRMPRRGQAMKDVASCDKPGGAARGL